MAESQRDDTQPSFEGALDAGSRLRQAREAAGLSRADIAATTKIPERHIVAIEAGDFAALAGRSYAIGFSRSYARAVGLDEQDIIGAVRQEMGAGDAEPEHRHAFEPGDPSRVPSKRIAWLAALAVLVVAVVLMIVWRAHSNEVGDPVDLTLSGEGTVLDGATPESGIAMSPSGLPVEPTAGAVIPGSIAPIPAVPAAPVAAPARAPARLGLPMASPTASAPAPTPSGSVPAASAPAHADAASPAPPSTVSQ